MLCRITDYSVPDDDKQVALVTATHVASELNSGTGLLRLVKWLISDDPAAQAIRRRQVVLVVPYSNPDGVARDGGSDVYMCWNFDGVVDPEKHPEAVALKRLIDEHQPEIHADNHGVWFAEQTMWESTGISWASGLSRSYAPDIPRLMNEAAEQAGFLITDGEQSAGQIRVTAPVPGADHHYYIRNANVNICGYSYHRYHTIAFTMESGYDESAVARIRKMLELGNEVWRGERYAGYPVSQVGCWTSMAISAWGPDAKSRRASRVELWNKLPQLTFGCAHPEPRGGIMAVCATTPPAATQFLDPSTVSGLVEKLKNDSRYDAKALADVANRIPAENFLPQYRGAAPNGSFEPIKNGLVIRLLVPDRDAEVSEIRLDGHLVQPSDTDGYHIRHNPGTIVEIAVPPDKVRELHVVSCFYDSPTKRRAGFLPEDWE